MVFVACTPDMALVLIPENGTAFMPFLAAIDDFRCRTLPAIGGVLQQLAYVIRLRNRDGQYEHWGLARTHGPEAAQNAIATNHSETWIALLRTPLQHLSAEMESMSDTDRAELLNVLGGYPELTCPNQLTGGGIGHFSSTVLALRLLFQAPDAKKAA